MEMNILDYIILGGAALALVLGLLKGFLKQIFTLAGVVVVSVGTAYVSPYAQELLAGISLDETTRMVIALIATGVVISIVYSLVTGAIIRVLTKSKTIGVLNRVLGAVLSVGVVYLIVAVLSALILDTSADFLPKIKEMLAPAFGESWIITNVYGNNFFGDWLIEGIVQKLLDGLQKDPTALAWLR